MATTDNRSATRRKLGRGLGSLISTPVRIEPQPSRLPAMASDVPAQATPASGFKPQTDAAEVSGLRSLPVGSIVPNPRQPRQDFDEASLQALANSIRISGVMQPVVVRQSSDGSAFELIAGERRWRAAQRAGLAAIPAIVRDVDDRTAAEFSLVENLQREDLNPIERAQAFQRLMSEFHLTHAEIAERVGLDRSSVSNHLRLLDLDDSAVTAVRSGRLTMGHAKALLALTNIEHRSRLAAEAVRQEWSVRELERRARDAATLSNASGGPLAAQPPARRSAAMPNPLATHLADLEKRLREHLGTKVAVVPGRAKGSGRLIIDFYSIDQFEGLLKRLDFDMTE